MAEQPPQHYPIGDLTPFEQLVYDRHLLVMTQLSRIERRVARLERDNIQRFGDHGEQITFDLTEKGRAATRDFVASLDVDPHEEKSEEGSGEVGESSLIES